MSNHLIFDYWIIRDGMNYSQITKKISTVPIYNLNGDKIEEIVLPEAIVTIPSKRVGVSDNEIYYKGAGIIYQSHYVNKCKRNEKIVGRTNIVYENLKVCYPWLVGKFGIFTFSHQECFSDFEGGCGKKEKNLIDMCKRFELSAIKEIVDVISIGINEHNIFVYKLRETKTEISDLVELIEYVLINDFNTAWDKNLWSDIYCFKYVRDLADWFVSPSLCHKLGTIYALLNSLYNSDVYIYCNLLKKLLKVNNCERNFILYFSALIVYKFCPQLFDNEMDICNLTPQLYEKLLKYLFVGNACCHLENDREWGWVREHYISRINGYVRKIERKLEEMD